MPPLKSFLGSLFGASKRLSDLEMQILNSVGSKIDARLQPLWGAQIQAINKAQRLPEGAEVNFYRMKGGQPSFDTELAFPNKTEELQLAKVEIEHPNVRKKLVARVWCVKGFLFSIEYEGSVNYFEEAAGLDSSSELHISSELTASLVDSN